MTDGERRKKLYDYLKGNKVSHFMEIDYYNITHGEKHNEMYEPYDKHYIQKVIDYFLDNEDYDKCCELRDYFN